MSASLVLAIETSCDDTSLALVSYDGAIIDTEHMLSYSQVAMHQPYGGVVPELASREHAHQITHVLYCLIQESMSHVHTGKTKQAMQLSPDQIRAWMKKLTAVAVTTTPGLPGSLAVGRTVARLLSHTYSLPYRPVHHIHGHLASMVLEKPLRDLPKECMVLTVSGGHNHLYLLSTNPQRIPETHSENNSETLGPWSVWQIGHSIDDAAGECFDKVARMLGGPYPGGPWISKMAQQGNPSESFRFSPSYLRKDEFLFSFSGMKSQAYRMVQSLQKQGRPLTDQIQADIAYEFEQAATHILAYKLIKAALYYDVASVALVGGVSANTVLRERIQQYADKYSQGNIQFRGVPARMEYCTDNAAMIGAAGWLEHL